MVDWSYLTLNFLFVNRSHVLKQICDTSLGLPISMVLCLCLSISVPMSVSLNQCPWTVELI